MESSKPLLDQTRPASSVVSHSVDSLISFCLPVLGLAFLLYSTLQALGNAREDPWAAAFAVTADILLILLWVCFQKFEKLSAPASEPSSAREQLKAAIWLLSTLLNLLFTLRIALIADSFICFVWGIAGTTTIFGVYLLVYNGRTPCPTASDKAALLPV